MYKHVPQSVIYNSKFGTNPNIQKQVLLKLECCIPWCAHTLEEHLMTWENVYDVLWSEQNQLENK